MRVATLISSHTTTNRLTKKEGHLAVATVEADIIRIVAGRALVTLIGDPDPVRQQPHLRIVGSNPTLKDDQVQPLHLRILVDSRLPHKALAQMEW